MIRKQIKLQGFSRGSHLVTHLITKELPELSQVECGLLNLFLCHTSAALSINENADSRVQSDLTMALDRIAPESWPYAHDDEGPDDMPAHVKSSLVGASLTIPIDRGRLSMGTWQGIYLLEFRNHPSTRTVVASIVQ